MSEVLQQSHTIAYNITAVVHSWRSRAEIPEGEARGEMHCYTLHSLHERSCACELVNIPRNSFTVDPREKLLPTFRLHRTLREEGCPILYATRSSQSLAGIYPQAHCVCHLRCAGTWPGTHSLAGIHVNLATTRFVVPPRNLAYILLYRLRGEECVPTRPPQYPSVSKPSALRNPSSCSRTRPTTSPERYIEPGRIHSRCCSTTSCT